MGALADDWSAARGPFEKYLKGLGIGDPEAVDRLYQAVLPVAEAMRQAGDERSAETLLCAALFQQLTRWFRVLFRSSPDQPDVEILQEGRLALIMADLSPERQRALAHMDQPLQDSAFIEQLRSVHKLAGPQSIFAELRPAPLELGPLPRWADSALSELDRAPHLRLTVLWLLALGFFGGLFFLTR